MCLYKAIVHSQEVCKFDVRPTAFPWKGFAGFITQTSGKGGIVVLDRDRVQESAGELATYLGELPKLALQKAPAYFLSPGQSVWIPFGHMPLIVGLSGTSQSGFEFMEDARSRKRRGVNEKIQPDFVSYAVTLCLNERFSESDGADVLAHLTRAWASIPPSIQQWGAMRKFKHALAPEGKQAREGVQDA